MQQKKSESLVGVARMAMQIAAVDAVNLQEIETLLDKGSDDDALIAMRCYFGAKKPNARVAIRGERKLQVQ